MDSCPETLWQKNTGGLAALHSRITTDTAWPKLTWHMILVVPVFYFICLALAVIGLYLLRSFIES